MGMIRKTLVWMGRIALVMLGGLVVAWLAIHISITYYRSQAARPPSHFIVENAPVIALIHARVVDGTGSAPADDQTVVVREGRISALGPFLATSVPPGARVIDLSGKSVIPGLVMMHEHLFTTSSSITAAIHGRPELLQESLPFPLMYLGGGVTTIRTAGSIDGNDDLALKRMIETGRRPGPDMFVTAPYLEGKPSSESASFYYHQMRQLVDPEDARLTVDTWADRGMTSFKAYMNITPDELSAAVQEAHSRGLQITGHLCSVGFTEAADLGIDNLEHGIMVDEEFFPGKKAGVCPNLEDALQYFDQKLEIESPVVQAMIRHLVDHHVALTSTLAVDEDFSGHSQSFTAMRDREYKSLGWRSWLMYLAISRSFKKHPYANLLMKEMQFERDFVKAGGLLLAGSDPTGDGGTLAGYGDQREIELLVKAGFSPTEAIHIATQNGAQLLGQSERIGTIAVGKQADLVVIDGDPATRISEIRRVEVVFKNGVGYSSEKLFGAVRGLVGVD